MKKQKPKSDWHSKISRSSIVVVDSNKALICKIEAGDDPKVKKLIARLIEMAPAMYIELTKQVISPEQLQIIEYINYPTKS